MSNNPNGKRSGGHPVYITDGGDETQGNKSDAAWNGTDPEASVISILKSITSGGGGGGGAVTIANGADVAEGNTADTAWTGIGAGTVIAILKAIFGNQLSGLQLSEIWDPAQNAYAEIKDSPRLGNGLLTWTNLGLIISGNPQGGGGDNITSHPYSKTWAQVRGTRVFVFISGTYAGANLSWSLVDPINSNLIPLPAKRIDTSIVSTTTNLLTNVVTVYEIEFPATATSFNISTTAFGSGTLQYGVWFDAGTVSDADLIGSIIAAPGDASVNAITVQGPGGDVITIQGSVTADQGGPTSLAAAWPFKITDTTNGPVAVKAPSNSPLATDAALVVGLSPNGNQATALKQDSQSTILTNINTNVAPLNNSANGAFVQQDSNGTIAKETGGNLATLVAIFASVLALLNNATGSALSVQGQNTTVPTSSDKALVVTLRDAIPAGTNLIGSTSVQALVSSSAQSYIDGATQPLSLTPDGRLRTSIVEDAVDYFPNPWEIKDIDPWTEQSPWD